MYVRLVSFQAAAPTCGIAGHKLHDTVLPTLRGHEGFAGYIGLIGNADQQVKGLVFFDSEENAEAANEPCKSDAGK